MPLSDIKPAFTAGEVAPALFGRTDLAKFHQGASTVRNMFVSYRGGVISRPGTAYVGMCKQGAPNVGGTATANPPRDISFQFSNTQGDVLEFGDAYMRVKSNGGYVTEAPTTISAISQATPAVITDVGHGYATGDWLFIESVRGLTELNGLTWIVNRIDADHYSLYDLFGAVVDSAPWGLYTGGGTAKRLYTLATPYAAIDLPYLKFTQSADTMTLACVNQATQTEYRSYELIRHGPANWALTADSFAAVIAAPTNVTAVVQSSTTVSTWYSYVVTAVDAATGEESVASPAVSIENNDIAVYAGSNTVSWDPVAGAGSYNVYKATPSYAQAVSIGVLYGYVGSALGTSFTDTNITADFTKVPPTHQNPFARGSILSVTLTAPGSGYTQATVGFTITSAAGSGFAGVPIILSGAVAGFLIENSGQNYLPGDTITLTDGGAGTGATASLTVGPESGTYPGTVAYYQQRRAYAASLNNPDTYWMSQPGAYSNMDSSVPTTDSDAITGTPWAQQVNGIQFMVPMPGGLVILTGKGAWQLTGGNQVALTPADQTAAPQAYNGCSSFMPPVPINFHILYVQSKGSIVRDLSYNFFANIYTGTDMTVLSSHLFSDHTLLQWAWAEEPFKIVWAVRDDGVLLSFTYLQEQDIYAWARHDTNGLFVGVCTITELPVDAVYVIVKRLVRGSWVYYSERLDDRLWNSVEESWCVDSGLSYPLDYPEATLIPSAVAGTGNITGAQWIYGGTNYTAPVVQAVDATGAGSGATFSVTVTDGTITAVTPLTPGQGYTLGRTSLVISDATGSGAVIAPIITNNVAFSASAAVFTAGMVGSVLRGGGGKATITAYVGPTQITANITQPLTAVVPNDPTATPVPIVSGAWSVSAPTSVVRGLNHLEGLAVAIVADGTVIPSQTVSNGQITLPQEYSQITVGLPFTAQLQSLYFDPAGPMTTQGKRKSIYAVTVRCQDSRGFAIGTNQPDASTQPYGVNVPWSGLKQAKEKNPIVAPGTVVPLFTGDVRVNVPSNWDTRGQIAVEQAYPLPLSVLAFVAEYHVGDTPG